MSAALLALLLLAPPARAAECVEKGSLPSLLDQAEALGPAERAGLDLARFLTAAVYRYACRGLAGAGPAACAELAGRDLRVPGARSLEWNCRHRLDEVLFIRDLARGRTGASPACARILTEQHGIAAPGRAAALCAALPAGGAAADEALCREVDAASGREPTGLRLKGCRAALGMYRGAREDCAALADEDYLAADVPLCRAARALRAKDCGGDPLCLAATGGGDAACAPFETEAKAVFAARRTAPDEKPAALPPEGAPRLSYADDAPPRVPAFAGARASARRGEAAAGAPVLRREAYPTFGPGGLRLPALYAEGKDYPAADRAALLALLPVLHHYADVNAAYAEGYRRAPERDGRWERVMFRAAARPEAGEPPYLRYVVDARSGRWQLVRAGFAADPKAAPGPRGPFVAAGVYDRAGLYAPDFPDATVLAAGARTFFGAVPPERRAPHPLCRP